ncbi:MAG: S49 family peptidase, partial [Verrucomicrobiales bacterium]|nr:S49 family peptidase [Verrucomicrobiales bacterium]
GVLGSAAPGRPGGNSEAALEAALAAYRGTLSVLVARMKAAAAGSGRDTGVISAMMDADFVLKDGEVIVKAAGAPLTLTAEEATGGYAGRSGIAQGVREIDAVLASVEAGEGVIRLEQGTLEEPAGEVEPEPMEVEKADVGEKTEERSLDFVRTEEESFAGKVVVLEVGEDDLVAKTRFEFMRRTVERAEKEGAKALVLDLNTPGGYAWLTAELIMKDLSQAKLPTVAYVNPSAISAGCLIAISADRIYMAPVSTIGSAGVVTGSGEALESTMRQKIYSMMISVARAVAAEKGHNPDVVEAFIDEDKEVVIDGVVISAKGKMLNLDQERATEVLGGRPVLAEGIAKDLEEVLELAGFAGIPTVKAEPLGMEAFALWVEGISILLILLGMAGAYMEMQTPGFGVPGFISALAFGLFFFGNNVAGKLAGYELVVVFVLGLVLIVVELVLVPGTLVAGILGFVLMMGALLFSMVDQVDFDLVRKGSESAPGILEVLREPVSNLVLGSGGALVLIVLAMFYLPKTRAINRLVLSDAIKGEPVQEDKVKAGDEGVAMTDLRPVGRGRFGDRYLEVTAGRGFVDEGAAIRVVESGGMGIRVEEVS